MTRTAQDPLPFASRDQTWQLDDEHRQAGRRGLADARAALAAATRRAQEREAAAHARRAA